MISALVFQHDLPVIGYVAVPIAVLQHGDVRITGERHQFADDVAASEQQATDVVVVVSAAIC